MTDKQIIIDGVNVSRCEFFDSGNCVECDMRVHFYGDIPCDDECNRNCHYKNWQRKEQECEELKGKLIKWLGKEGITQSEKEFYEEQLDQLKRQHESDKGLITATGKMNYELLQEYDKLKTENDELKKKCNIYTCGICGNKDDCNKLYKTLTEIKNKLTVHKTLYYESKLIEKLHKQILQKISEWEANQ